MTSVSSTQRGSLDFATSMQGQNGIGGAGIGNVVLRVPTLRRREPAATGALMLLEPGDSATNARIVRRHARLPQDIEGQTRGIAVACQGRLVDLLPPDIDQEFAAVLRCIAGLP